MGRTGTASLPRTCRAKTAAESQCSTGRHRVMRWRPSISLSPTSSASICRRGSGDGTSSGVTSPPKIPQDKWCSHNAQGAPPGSRTSGGEGPKYQPRGARGRLKGGGDYGSVDDGGARINAVPLPPATAPMVSVREDVENDPGREGGAVPDILHHRDRLSYF